MNRLKKSTIQFNDREEKNPLRIVSEAALATCEIDEGRLVPLLIVDTSQRPDVENMVRAHRHFGQGDVVSRWVAPKRFGNSKLQLFLEVLKPSKCILVLEFDIAGQSAVIEQICQAQGLYIQPGRMGDRVSNTMENDRILLEVPRGKFYISWQRIWRKALYKKFRSEGLARDVASEAVSRFLQEWSKLSQKRIWRN